MRHKAHGFTLVELNLAMIFVAILVIGIAVTTINVTKINQRGIMLKTINQTGREVMDQLRRDVASARTDKIEYVAPTGGVGRLCLGSVSYIFNTAEALHGSGTLIRDATQTNTPPVTLVRVDDKDGAWCQQTAGVFVKNEVVASDQALELLQVDTLPVAIHAMDVQQIAQTVDSNATQGLVMVMLQIGTNEADTIQAGGTCKPPTDHQANFDNCAVREFRTVVRSNGVS